jgi:hypothetical protein
MNTHAANTKPCSADWQSAADWESASPETDNHHETRVTNPRQVANLHYMASTTSRRQFP